MSNPSEHRILLVDDEQSILNAVRRELLSPPLGRIRYQLETFTDPLEALACAKTEPFEVVISDYKMPHMDGLAFLKAFALEQPDCIRMVMSGQTDLAALTCLINETHIYRFIPKPWTSYFLKSSLAQAVDSYRHNAEYRRLSQVLTTHGVSLPRGIAHPAGPVLVVAHTIDEGKAIARILTQRNELNDLFRTVLTEGHNDVTGLPLADLHVDIATSPQQALKLSGETLFACVIADYRSSGMDGAQFLVAFKEKQPECQAIMVAEEASMDEVILALDLAHLSALIAKPWTDFELYAAVAQAMSQHHTALCNRALAEICTSRGFNSFQ